LESGITLAPDLTSSLFSWYEANRRDLPWRAHPDPYGILVSEFMLQQTTVPAVLPYFQRWMEKYPTIKNLAEANPEQVLLDWEGLGYYSRARNLHASAREVVSRYGGNIPKDPAILRKLPGVGDYTAAAVSSIAFGVRAVALDANNIRVLSRLLAEIDRKRIVRTVSRILPMDRPGDFNQALMDLGSSVCTPNNPLCLNCPINKWCRAYRKGEINLHPAKAKANTVTQFEAAIGIILKDGRVLVQKRQDSGLLAGMWEFPGGNIGKGEKGKRGKGGEKAKRGNAGTRRHGVNTIAETPEEAVVREVQEETGLRIKVCEKLGVFNHNYTQFRVKLHVFLCRRKSGTLRNSAAKWVMLEELESLPMPSANRRIVKKLEERLTAVDAE
jgi:A/G-specific adenine glycosylase